MAKVTFVIEDIGENVGTSYNVENESGEATPGIIFAGEINKFINHYLIHHGATQNIENFKNQVRAEIIAEYTAAQGNNLSAATHDVQLHDAVETKQTAGRTYKKAKANG